MKRRGLVLTIGLVLVVTALIINWKMKKITGTRLEFERVGRVWSETEIKSFCAGEDNIIIYDGSKITAKSRADVSLWSAQTPSDNVFVRADKDLVYAYDSSDYTIKIYDPAVKNPTVKELGSPALRCEIVNGNLIVIRESDGLQRVYNMSSTGEKLLFSAEGKVIGIELDEDAENGVFRILDISGDNINSSAVFIDSGVKKSEIKFESEVLLGIKKRASKYYAITDKNIYRIDGADRQKVELPVISDFLFTDDGIFISYSDVVEKFGYDLKSIDKKVLGIDILEIFRMNGHIFARSEKEIAGYIESDPIYYNCADDVKSVSYNGRFIDILSENYIETIKLTPKKTRNETKATENINNQ